ncbi:MAG TPA: cupin domain-containing protein [Acidimicrobiales bacterium]|nr:cupin domain-containing protein [Acidimicrobiales bacterium]
MSTPSADAPGADGAAPGVRLLTRAELLRGAVNDLPGTEGPGCARTAYPGLRAGTFRSTLMVMPVGQRSPARTSDIEHVIVVLEGAFVFTVDGVDYRVEALDQLFVPVGVVWEYQNAALAQSTYLAIVGP